MVLGGQAASQSWGIGVRDSGFGEGNIRSSGFFLPVLDVQPDGILDVLDSFFICLALAVAALESGT
jgi:hypothetical protein